MWLRLIIELISVQLVTSFRFSAYYSQNLRISESSHRRLSSNIKIDENEFKEPQKFLKSKPQGRLSEVSGTSTSVSSVFKNTKNVTAGGITHRNNNNRKNSTRTTLKPIIPRVVRPNFIKESEWESIVIPVKSTDDSESLDMISEDEKLGYQDGDFKSGFVSILGNPNVGKSTLINALLGESLCIVSPKPQTTRHRILGVLTEKNYQLVFSDTPGMMEPVYKLQEAMMDSVRNCCLIIYAVLDSSVSCAYIYYYHSLIIVG